jgi:hypothetical protein
MHRVRGKRKSLLSLALGNEKKKFAPDSFDSFISFSFCYIFSVNFWAGRHKSLLLFCIKAILCWNRSTVQGCAMLLPEEQRIKKNDPKFLRRVLQRLTGEVKQKILVKF